MVRWILDLPVRFDEFSENLNFNFLSIIVSIHFFLAATGQPQAAPPPSQIEDQQQAPQQNHANYQQNDQVSQQNYQDWNQYNQQHQGYSDQGTYSYWDGNNYVNYVSHYLHYEKKGLDHSGAGSDSSGAFLGSQRVEKKTRPFFLLALCACRPRAFFFSKVRLHTQFFHQPDKADYS